MKIMVCGAGTMGAGIAQVMIEAGQQVILMDISEEMVNKGLNAIEKNLVKKVSKGKMMPQEKERAMRLISCTTSLKEAAEVELVMEAVTENKEIKKNLFQNLDSICPPEVIFASNTSALSISELASATTRPDRFVGLHFFIPAPVMKLVEIIKGAATSEETYLVVQRLAADLGKTAVTVMESPGFVVNRILIPMVNEAIYLLMEGVASAEDIDTAMKLGSNHPIGPLALADMIGLDVVLFIMDTLYAEFADSKYRPCPLLRKMVRGGMLGCKSGRGFYIYNAGA